MNIKVFLCIFKAYFSSYFFVEPFPYINKKGSKEGSQVNKEDLNLRKVVNVETFLCKK